MRCVAIILKQKTKLFVGVIHYICISCKDVEGHLRLACSQDEAIDQDNIFATLVIVYNIMHTLYRFGFSCV